MTRQIKCVSYPSFSQDWGLSTPTILFFSLVTANKAFSIFATWATPRKFSKAGVGQGGVLLHRQGLYVAWVLVTLKNRRVRADREIVCVSFNRLLILQPWEHDTRHLCLDTEGRADSQTCIHNREIQKSFFKTCQVLEIYVGFILHH